MYIRTVIPYIIRKDLSQDTLELLSIEVKKPKSKPLLISTWYRPPSAKIELFKKFENFLKLIDNEDKDIIITGDLNCNLIEHAQNYATSKLIDIIDIFQLQQHIQTPTRITYNSSSLIDLILTHIDDDKILEAGVVDLGISDHSLVYKCRKISILKEPPKIVFSRQFKNYSSYQFKEELRLSFYTSRYLTSNDPNVLWNEFKSNFLAVAEKHAPIRQRRVKREHKPWLTKCTIGTILKGRVFVLHQVIIMRPIKGARIY